jgi:glycogen debranching enzyme
MDAKVGSWVVTPRHGKPVEIQALWINALRLASGHDPKWREVAKRALRSFRERFWNAEAGCLYDVIDGPGGVDASMRPNQIFAVGGLPVGLLRADQARSVVDAVERELWTPMGPRTLAQRSNGYRGRYEGDTWSRDGAYHQGTAWPWLIGAFVEAWVRVCGGTSEAKAEARRKFMQPMLAHLGEAGLGHVSEIADADGPHSPRGCPFQAWSVGELVRLERVVLAPPATDRARGPVAGKGVEAATKSARTRGLKASLAKGPTVT